MGAFDIARGYHTDIFAVASVGYAGSNRGLHAGIAHNDAREAYDDAGQRAGQYGTRT